MAPTPSQSPKAATLQETCDRGLALHRQGRLEEARAQYKKVLQRDPRHFAALRLLGHLCAATGQAELGSSLLRRAIAARPDLAAPQAELGEVLRGLGRCEEAVACFDRALGLTPGLFEAHHNRGLALQALGRSNEAVASYDRAIALRSDLAQPFYNRGVALQAADRLVEALDSYDKAIARNPKDPEAHNNRGIVSGRLGRHEAAVASFDRAIALQPGYADAHDNRGVALQELERLEEAVASFERALVLNPGSAEAHFHRGGALGALQRHADALASFDRAIALRADYGEAWANRAAALGGLERHAEALASAETAIALKRNDAEAWNAAALALRDLERYEEALAHYDRAIDLRPGYAEARLNRGMLLLLLGRFEAGWRDYEWRKRKWDLATDDLADESLWTGAQDPAGRRLFVYHEQGVGDTIHFSRYVGLLQGRGAEVVMSAQRPLHPVLRSMFPGVELLGPGEAPARIDHHCSLLSLPLAFGTTVETIPPPGPRPRPDDGRRAGFQARLGPRTKPRVGIAWSGNPDHKNDRNRSIAFERLAPLLVEEIEWVALQNEIRPADLDAFERCGRVRFLGEALADFGDTAALAELMDIVIAVDTSVAHLAGALGKPVWILLPFRPDFRWMLGRADSPWYPGARLFRQPLAGDWESVIGSVAAELAKAVGDPTPRRG